MIDALCLMVMVVEFVLWFSIAAGIDKSCTDRESVAGHLLLFISALIPKAVASLLTSAVIELSKTENVMY